MRKDSTVRFESSGRNLTSQAGLIPVIKFLDKLGFNGLFNRHVHHQRAKNAYYSLADGVFLMMIGLIGSAFSIGSVSSCGRMRSCDKPRLETDP